MALHVFAAPDAAHLVHPVCSILPQDVEPGNAVIANYHNGEFNVEITQSVAGDFVFVIGSDPLPTAMLADCARRSSAKEVIVCIPCLPYGRGTVRKEDRRKPINLPLALAPILQSRPSRILFMDVPRREAFAFLPIDHTHLYGSLYAVAALKQEGKVTVIPLDTNGWSRARRFAELLTVTHRPGAEYVPEGEDVLIVENILDDPTHLLATLEVLGKRRVCAYFSHAYLTPESMQALDRSSLSRIYLTDTVARPPELLQGREKFAVLSCAPLVAEVIRRVGNGESLARDTLAAQLRSVPALAA